MSDKCSHPTEKKLGDDRHQCMKFAGRVFEADYQREKVYFSIGNRSADYFSPLQVGVHEKGGPVNRRRFSTFLNVRFCTMEACAYPSFLAVWKIKVTILDSAVESRTVQLELLRCVQFFVLTVCPFLRQKQLHQMCQTISRV